MVNFSKFSIRRTPPGAIVTPALMLPACRSHHRKLQPFLHQEVPCLLQNHALSSFLAVLFTNDWKQTADLLVAVSRFCYRLPGPDYSSPRYRAKATTHNVKMHQLGLLQSIPGIGKACAIRLLNRFSFEELLKAAPEELNAVKGIGRERAEKILTIVQGRQKINCP